MQARSSKELAKRLRFDHVPRPDIFRRFYWIAGVLVGLAGVGIWVLFSGIFSQRQYMPGPVSRSHATFGDRCHNCHRAFQAVPDDACLDCHTEQIHSQFQPEKPACRECHVEHRESQALSAVNSRKCVGCHDELVSTRGEPAVRTRIDTFRDHPAFVALRDGEADRAAIRFNHKIHLTSKKIPPADVLRCDHCHRPAADGRYMRPIVFEDHCRRCHELRVNEIPSPIADIQPPHGDPQAVHDALAAGLLALAVQRPAELFESRDTLLPGRAPRGPVDESISLREYQRKWLQRFEGQLYKAFRETPPLVEGNRYCFLCHLQKGSAAEGELPQIEETKIPSRWLRRGEFSHRRHELVACQECHPKVETSEATSDTNLPSREVCLKCHVDDAEQSAGTGCTLCHLYHGTSKEAPPVEAGERRMKSIDVLTGKAE